MLLEGAMTTLRIQEVAARAETTAYTLRYYESIGLLRPKRTPNGHRAYEEDDVRRVVFWRRLHETGMPIRTMRAYAKLLAKGDSTVAERKQMLLDHREAVRAKIDVLRRNLRTIDAKIEHYDEIVGLGRARA